MFRSIHTTEVHRSKLICFIGRLALSVRSATAARSDSTIWLRQVLSVPDLHLHARILSHTKRQGLSAAPLPSLESIDRGVCGGCRCLGDRKLFYQHREPDARRPLTEGERRLAAIMYTDLVGYTALGQRNEALSLAVVEEQRRLIRPILAKHNGREVKTMGDASLVVLPSALDAVRCAYDVQRTTREYNFALPYDRSIHLRVGVHLGDVIESAGDVFGDAVNIASRIETLAEDGGVCITRQVYDQVQNKFELPFKSLGPRSLKNVNLPIEVYRIVMPWEGTTRSDKTRIAVLPFLNISPDPNDEYFSDGITDELISTISKIQELGVIARTSAMKYKGSGKGIAEIGRELQVGSILEGTVRKAGSKLRITVQLIDPQTEEDMWTESYDRELQDVFGIQSDIAKRVAEALKVRLRAGETQGIESIPTANIEAYGLYLKGRISWNSRTREGLDEAVRYFEAAVKLDPKYARAYSGLADCYIIYGDYGWLEPREAFPRARENALRSLEIDPRQAESHVSLAAVYSNYEWRWREAESEFREAIELGPSYATAQQWYGLFLLFIRGKVDEAYDRFEKAHDLDPLSKIINDNLRYALVLKGRRREAIDQLKSDLVADPDRANTRTHLGVAYYLDSRIDEAIDQFRTVVEMPGSDIGEKVDLAMLLGIAHQNPEAERLLTEILEATRTRYVPKIWIAEVLFAMGRMDEGFVYLDGACEERSASLDHGNSIFTLRIWPSFGELLKDSRWADFEERLGLRQIDGAPGSPGASS